MGSMPRLKIKDKLHYRKGSTNEAANCQYCKSFNRDYPIAHDMPAENRCELIGMNPGARYRVRPDFKCDHQELDRSKCSWLPENQKGAVK